MIVQIKSITQENSWYGEALGEKFNVYNIEGGLFYVVDPYFPLIILKSDAEVISKSVDDFYYQ